MSYIPPGIDWYIADLIIEFIIEDDTHPLVHVNTRLIQATSPEEAHAKALVLGHEEEDVYQNPEGKRVEARFRGLGNLLAVYEELEDGSELMYKEKTGLDEAQISALVSRKEDLAVFKD